MSKVIAVTKKKIRREKKFFPSGFIPILLIASIITTTLAINSKNFKALFLPKAATGQLVAFPGAEGFGENTTGGRGGRVYVVTNLNDSGAGSLRECVAASGTRTCVFRVAGLINLSSPLTITNPNLTIAGQTAPGGGITLKKVSGGDVFNVRANNVIIRYITSRPGPGGSNHALIFASNGVEVSNVIIDHSSFSWATDEVFTSWYRVTNLTLQWSIISEGLNCSTHPKGCHSKGMMLGGYAGSEDKNSKGSENITAHHNLMAHNGERGPLMQTCGTAQVVNNVTYNYLYTFAHQQDNCIIPNTPVTINWIGNYHKRGPDGSSNDAKFIPSDEGVYSGGKAYLSGNIGPLRTSNSQPESDWMECKNGGTSCITSTPATGPAITTTDALTAYNQVLADAGNNKGLTCEGAWFERRDAIDLRVVNDAKNGTGRIIDSPSEVGGWITPAAGTACTDDDLDGMADVWEMAKFGTLARGSAIVSSTDKDGDGYTDLEEYLNGTDPNVSDTGTVVITPTSTQPTGAVTITTTPRPTSLPTPRPTNTPTSRPTVAPTPIIINTPTTRPTNTPSPRPTNTPTPRPANTATPRPTVFTPTPTGVPQLTKLMTVSSVYYDNTQGWFWNNRVTVHLKIVDKYTAGPVYKALVYYVMKNKTTGKVWTSTGYTDSLGIENHTINYVPAGCYTTTITKIVKSDGWVWDGITPNNEYCIY